MKRRKLLENLVTKWHTTRQRAVPLKHLLEYIADDIDSGIREIPADKIYDCWVIAKAESDFMPMDSSLLKAWREKVNTAVHIANSRIGYSPKHECPWCPVVAIRIHLAKTGEVGGVPDPTTWEIAQATQDITHKELSCMRSVCRIGTPELEHWNESPKSPYRGLL
jgi:hypothetical protein